MTRAGADRLYERLPAVHRLRDDERGRPLQALLRAAAEQAAIVAQDLDRLWDDLAIETCRDWVVPYIGDLVANEPLEGGGAPARVDVAKTISYRRRKGTVPLLAELAGDVTGWGAHAVEAFELLGWTQHLDHLRPQAAWFDVRDPERAGRVDGPFDGAAHSVDVRPPADGLHHIAAVAFFAWRLRSYPVQGVVLATPGGAPVHVRPPAREAGAPNRFHVSTLGAPVTLFSRRRPADRDGLPAEATVPGALRPAAFHADLARLDDEPDATLAYYGPAQHAGLADTCFPEAPAPVSGGSLAVFVDDVAVPAGRILCKDLSAWAEPPAGSDRVAVDVVTGRIAFAPDADVGAVTVEYHYGFAGDLGGGPYDRRRARPAARHRNLGPDTVADPAALFGNQLSVSPVGDHALIGDALGEWADPVVDLPPIVVEIADDRAYAEDLVIDVTNAAQVVVQAANGRRPTLLGSMRITGANPGASVALDGLLIAGAVEVEDSLGRLRISHCTLVPGGGLDSDGEPLDRTTPALVLSGDATALEVLVEHSIIGPVRAPGAVRRLHVHTSVVDGLDVPALAGAGGDDPGAPTTLERVTVLGDVRVRCLDLASEVIVTGTVEASRTQKGCVRYSYVAPGSRTPQRYRCQPDLALDAAATPAEEARVQARLRPGFTSVRYGDPGYAQLSRTCPAAIAVGGEGGTEMGAFAWLQAPRRHADLCRRAAEHLPFGLEPVFVFVT